MWPDMTKTMLRAGLVCAYLLPAIHLCFIAAICVKDVKDIVPRIGMIDFPLTIIASPVLMNVDMSVVWIVLYYATFGSLFWYLIGRGVDKLFLG
jgi:hypothetical protein